MWVKLAGCVTAVLLADVLVTFFFQRWLALGYVDTDSQEQIQPLLNSRTRLTDLQPEWLK